MVKEGFRHVARLWPLLSLLLIVVVIGVVGLGLSEVWQRVFTTALIQLVLVVGLYMFVGTSGVLSLGHMSFMGIGAYVTGILMIPTTFKNLNLPYLPGFVREIAIAQIPAVLIGGVAAVVFAAVIGLPLMRLNGIAAALAMFAVLIIVHVVTLNWKWVTPPGSTAIFGVPTQTTLFRAMIAALVAIAVAYVFQESRVGLCLRASRDEEAAARSVGIGVVGERRIALGASAFVVGCGGGLWAGLIGTFSANDFFVAISFLTLAMLVVGGLNSLAGAVLGTVVIAAVAEILRRLEGGFSVGVGHVPGRAGLREVGLAIIMLLVLSLRPAGLTGGRELRWPGPQRLLRRGASGNRAEE